MRIWGLNADIVQIRTDDLITNDPKNKPTDFILRRANSTSVGSTLFDNTCGLPFGRHFGSMNESIYPDWRNLVKIRSPNDGGSHCGLKSEKCVFYWALNLNGEHQTPVGVWWSRRRQWNLSDAPCRGHLFPPHCLPEERQTKWFMFQHHTFEFHLDDWKQNLRYF